MHVLYDHQCFTGHTYGGVSRYFFDLMCQFSRRTDIQFDLSLRLSNNDYLTQASFSQHLTYRRLAESRSINRAASVLNRLASIRRLRAGRFDVFHPTYYHRYFLGPLAGRPFVLTFHDATSERYGHQYPELGKNLTAIKKTLLHRADAVIAVSEFSKSEILRFFPISADKITVVPLGTTFGQEPPAGPAEVLPFAYLLFVGKRPLYKNFDGFLRAMRPVLERHPDLHIVCAGGGAFSPDEQAHFYAAGLAGRVHFRPVTDASLFGLYRRARAFVFPSLNEGFGIPVLEAFSAGCPVVLSNRSSLPEVAAEAGVYFDPEDDDSMAGAVEQVITDEALRDTLRRRGTDRLKQFSCERTARQTLAVYQSLV